MFPTLPVDPDQETVPPAGGHMGAPAHRGHLHKEAAGHHGRRCQLLRLQTGRSNAP